jgi:hypothetical protein
MSGPETALALLDRSDRRIQRLDHTQPVTQLADRGQLRVRGQRGSGVPIRGCCRCRFLARILTAR